MFIHYSLIVDLLWLLFLGRLGLLSSLLSSLALLLLAVTAGLVFGLGAEGTYWQLLLRWRTLQMEHALEALDISSTWKGEAMYSRVMRNKDPSPIIVSRKTKNLARSG
jgi:hypothetical protein